MKKWFVALLLFLGGLATVHAQQLVRYGYCPESLTPEDGLAQGTGKNKYVAAMIGLDPSSDPALKRLKGRKIKGVRCYLRDDYKQASQKRSFVMVCEGVPTATPVKKICNFKAGWNEVYLDQPVTIGDEKLFVGYQVFETVGAPYPLLVDGAVSVPGGCWVNLDRKGWEEKKGRGTLMIQAILEEEAEPQLERTVYAQIARHPLTLKPDEEFSAAVYLKNMSGRPVTTLSLQTLGAGDEAPVVQTVDFEPALAPYDGRMLSLNIKSGKAVGTQQEMLLNVTTVEGEEALPALAGKSLLHVTQDAFLRIPLVEEFTSQFCPNCPYMIYYVEKAREVYEGPLLYVTHHTGFQNDAFTLKNEEELCYLFGEGQPYNPAIMFDRLMMEGENNVVLPSTGEPSHLPYLSRMEELAKRPAMAEVLVDVDTVAARLNCRVHGRINSEIAAAGTPLYLTVYLVEDGLTLDKYPQQGLDVDDAPADLVQNFRHNGVIRHSFTQAVKGDALEVAGDATFSVEFPALEWNKLWKSENCQVVAFVHKKNEANLAENEVLNAGSNRYNHLITGVEDVRAEQIAPVRFRVGADRVVRTDMPVRELRVYTLGGALCAPESPLLPGVYVARAVTAGGHIAVQKLLVR